MRDAGTRRGTRETLGMTSRERLVAAMRGQPTDRVPVAPFGLGRVGADSPLGQRLVEETDLLLDVWSGADPFLGSLARVECRTEGETVAYGDRPRLVQALLNLVLNAADAMHGEGTLHLRATRQADTTTIEVGDTGPGIDPSIAKKIFDPFFTTKETGTGTGLGLSLAQKIVHESDGEIWFESTPGSTTFFVTLPATRRRLYA